MKRAGINDNDNETGSVNKRFYTKQLLFTRFHFSTKNTS